jgi:hypothetical protein
MMMMMMIFFTIHSKPWLNGCIKICYCFSDYIILESGYILRPVRRSKKQSGGMRFSGHLRGTLTLKFSNIPWNGATFKCRGDFTITRKKYFLWNMSYETKLSQSFSFTLIVQLFNHKVQQSVRRSRSSRKNILHGDKNSQKISLIFEVIIRHSYKIRGHRSNPTSSVKFKRPIFFSEVNNSEFIPEIRTKNYSNPSLN